jgi:hypothetical protein
MEIARLNYRDLSIGRASDIVRQLQQLRVDVKETGKYVTEELKPQVKGNPNSPYAPERVGEQKILGTDIESSWRRRLDLIY